MAWFDCIGERLRGDFDGPMRWAFAGAIVAVAAVLVMLSQSLVLAVSLAIVLGITFAKESSDLMDGRVDDAVASWVERTATGKEAATHSELDQLHDARRFQVMLLSENTPSHRRER